MNLPKNVNDLLPTGFLNNILPGGRGGAPSVNLANLPKNPLDAVNDILPTGMINNIIPGAGGGGAISIVLDNPSNCYYAGTVVTGKVIMVMDKTDNIRGLSIKIKGEAIVSWTESGPETTQTGTNRTQQETVTTSYSSGEEYFSNKYNILGESEVPAGSQTYQFSSPLPPLLPSSFTGEYGGVKYSIKATVDRPWKFDLTTELEFKVVSPMDLNHNAVAKEPVKKEISKTFCCLFCQSGPLTLVVNLPYSGYVPGQPINVAIEADNASNIEISDVVVKLNKTITWICHKPDRKERSTHTELAKVQLEGVNPHGSKTWSQQVSIPADMPVTNIDACSVIKMKHILQVCAEVGGCHQNLNLEIPLIIGTSPIQSGAGGMNPVFPNSIPGGDTGFPPAGGPGYPAAPAQGGYPPASGQGGYPTVPAQGGYPPAPGQGGFPAQGGYPAAPAQGGYPPAPGQGGYPAQGGYPPAPGQGGYPPVPGQYPPASVQPGYPASAPSAPPDSPNSSASQPLLSPSNIGLNLPPSSPYP